MAKRQKPADQMEAKRRGCVSSRAFDYVATVGIAQTHEVHARRFHRQIGEAPDDGVSLVH
jgi:hypothetical protein